MTNAKIVLAKIAHSQRLNSFRTSAALILTTLMLMVAAATRVATAQTYTDLFNFAGYNGSFPVGTLAQGREGDLYGTAPEGGKNGYECGHYVGCGVVFRVSPSGKSKVLYKFDGVDGRSPYSGLTLGTDGTFYGTTTWGGTNGYGIIFKITHSGGLTTLHTFTGGTDGAYPYASPIQGADDNFYGTTNSGTAYKITPSGVFTSLASIPSGSAAPLLQAIDGNFYGTTGGGGKYNQGTVFEITPKGIVKIVYNFGGKRGFGPGPLTLGNDGNLYGTTYEGGSTNQGVVFKLTPQGAITVLHNFRDPNYPNDGYYGTGALQGGLVQATDGNFYGATYRGGTLGYGVIFQITQAGVYSIPYNFDGTHGGVGMGLVQHTNGKIYGLVGGGTNNKGVVYSLDMELGPFVSLLSASGKVGKTIEVLGQGFTGTTAVSFNGTPATFKVVSDTYLTATVPSRATTGAVTVTTPGGTLTSNKPFRITPVVKTFSPTSGPAGTPVTITGNSLTQTTKVAFGGVKATTFSVDSDTQVTATVPTGAKTGHIAITTTGGSTWSPGVFTVTQ
jgi:uncharacterized repeat protein (TIGR03803 family)